MIRRQAVWLFVQGLSMEIAWQQWGRSLPNHLLHHDCKPWNPSYCGCIIACAGDGCLANTSYAQSSVGSVGQIL